jgi:ubiquinone/menaquinone biosynthesis C-methylase UbiE
MNQDVIWDHFQNEGVESFARANPRLEFIVRKLKAGERALNIGVGSGALERLAASKDVEIWTLDPSERAIEKLREMLPVGDRARQGYSQSMPFPDGHFDAVIMSEVLEHLDEDVRQQTLDEVHRVLKAGGRFLGTVPAREQLEANAVVCPHCEHHFHRWGHQKAFDIASVTKMLRRLFKPELVEERFFNEWDSAGWGRRLTGLLKKFLSWRGLGTYGVSRSIFFIARKA